MMKAKVTIKNMIAWVIGNWRYQLYYSDYKWLLRKHIIEQIDWRIDVMDKQCFNEGSCKLCGCETTALQMANKACDKPCYPKMMNSIEWKEFKAGNYELLEAKSPGYIIWTFKKPHKTIIKDGKILEGGHYKFRQS